MVSETTISREVDFPLAKDIREIAGRYPTVRVKEERKLLLWRLFTMTGPSPAIAALEEEIGNWAEDQQSRRAW